ncbi:hypothetical protein BN7_2938 [Wickerhamomyces ciferrii]|uniref:Uncharacterized protein n=1 Tax=Wickerhamomyces ciferrii (strain ATCC 14091 / BCRC 22168 / CBS 111 / JCM 3599 / NBRC 0793 / NRRL Y-1031 F-60-10) TaxID=1206466 RepID=K0KE61_WICCF|nr:uncharacterized protein BN7_2938 [Wickerhamomyces ciferrii]CCH43390.1 hypothetical protein BN7_2938 [Wickerhamomyces ciferrii]
MLKTIAKYIFYAFLASSYKSLPGAYYIRFWYQAAINIIIPKYIKSLIINDLSSKSPFETSSIHTYNSPFECDGYFHKSNSTYFEELDISRTKLMTTIFQKFFMFYKTESKTWPYVPVANVFSTFKKEIKPYQKYEVKNRILGWDQKWLFILSKFVSIGKKGEVIHAVCITKYVLKDGRKTVSPRDALKFCGYQVEKYEKESEKGVELVKWFVDTGDVEVLDI